MSTSKEIREVYLSEVRRPYDYRRRDRVIQSAMKFEKTAQQRMAELLEIEQFRRKHRGKP